LLTRMEYMLNLAEKAGQNLALIKERKPLIHNITNYVVMNFTANALLSMGASPVMAHAEEEVEEMVSFAGALVLNIGTLSEGWIRAMIKAGRKAAELKKPIILDPVGSGATSLRTRTAREIIEQTDVTVIRGNASEVLSLKVDKSKTKGVDSIHSVEDAAETAGVLASELGATLAITGPVDLVTDGARIVRILNGHPLMGQVTGTGCVATAVTGAFLAVDQNPVDAVVSSLGFLGLAGEKAGSGASGPGSFQVAFLDALYSITPDELTEGIRLENE
jgi:hydroxyethylthiazole kinase